MFSGPAPASYIRRTEARSTRRARLPQRGFPLLIVLLVGVGLLSGCKKKAGGTAAAFPTPRVIVIEAQLQPVEETLSLVGTLAANESVELKPESDGVIREIHFQEGQHVRKGDLLVTLDAEKFAAAVAEAEANFKLSESTYQRNKQLLADKLISQQDYDQSAANYQFTQATLELKRRQLQDARMVAPFEGVVGARNVSPGQVINRTTAVTWLIDLDPIKVEISVPERFLNQIRVGQKVSFNVAAFPGRKFEGEVYFIASHLDEATRTALIKALIPNPNSDLRSGMFASLELGIRIRDSAIVVPEVALLTTADATSVFVVGPDLVAQFRPVKPGVRLAGRVEIVEGLKAGERVVVEGTQKTIPGKPVMLIGPDGNPIAGGPAPKPAPDAKRG